MNKQDILTVLGVVFSLIIAFFIWLLTNTLLDRQEIALFASTGSIHNPALSEDIDTDFGQKTNTVIDPVITGEKLDKDSKIKIAKILSTWHNDRSYTRPHEPVEGQLNMKQAFDAAEAGLSYFSSRGIIKEELLQDGFTPNSASLYENKPDEGADTELSPEYSYWLIDLSYEKISVRLRMNAVTGVIWEISIYPTKEGIQVTGLDASEILDIYTEYLGLEGEDSVRYNEGVRLKSF